MLIAAIATLFRFNKYRKQIALKHNSLKLSRAQNSNKILTHANSGNLHENRSKYQVKFQIIKQVTFWNFVHYCEVNCQINF